ncbi:glucoside xylosyltransferase 1 [Amyelois transitella]|uniref:glucoside xylosyltransferase 1 n=1 Tax=Amyelois transitella TaxID=680683 RepID=UPI00298FBAC3|nr:glucoside xylosyltransferase 1 [Amyelois transitella]
MYPGIMRKISLCRFFVILCGLTITYIFYSKVTDIDLYKKYSNKRFNRNVGHPKSTDKIIISFVVCDSRFEESLNVIKSVLLFTKTPVYFVIFADDVLKPKFKDILSKWKSFRNDQLDFELKSIKFPEAHKDDWLNLFSKCAAQRLFIPDLVPHFDAMIYVDTDTLFLGPVDEVWSYFSKFNSSQLTAMTLEHENPNVSWYPRFAKHPFYGKTGLNSGVMLMNLTRMRDFGWVVYVTPIMMKWKLNIPWGDQDIINIILHYHERAVYVLPCRYNYRTDQCVYGDACADATTQGVHLLHGSRQAFHKKEPAFQAIYRAIDEHDLARDTPESLLNNMEKYFANTTSTNCGSLKDAFFRVPVKTLTDFYSKPDR